MCLSTHDTCTTMEVKNNLVRWWDEISMDMHESWLFNEVLRGYQIHQHIIGAE